jgi:hypothetical protein
MLYLSTFFSFILTILWMPPGFPWRVSLFSWLQLCGNSSWKWVTGSRKLPESTDGNHRNKAGWFGSYWLIALDWWSPHFQLASQPLLFPLASVLQAAVGLVSFSKFCSKLCLGMERCLWENWRKPILKAVCYKVKSSLKVHFFSFLCLFYWRFMF